jgi:hypothetical protein
VFFGRVRLTAVTVRKPIDPLPNVVKGIYGALRLRFVIAD